MRCLEPAAPKFEVDAREVSQPGEGEELESPYVDHGRSTCRAGPATRSPWRCPAQLLCRPECAGLCPVCGADLNLAGPGSCA